MGDLLACFCLGIFLDCFQSQQGIRRIQPESRPNME